MAKTLRIQSTNYTVTANVVRKSNKGFEIDTFKATCETRNERLVKRAIIDLYANDGVKVKGSDILITEIVPFVTSTVYKIDASVEQIVNACAAAGISVVQVKDATDTDTDGDTDTSENN